MQLRKERQRCEQMRSAATGVENRTEPPVPSLKVPKSQASQAGAQDSKQQFQPSPKQQQQQQEEADMHQSSEPEGQASAQLPAEGQGAEQSQLLWQRNSQPHQVRTRP